MNSDNEFVLSLMFFRMIEATKPHKIDDLIKDLEKKIDTSKPIEIKSGKELFETFTTKLTERDLELGKCFKDSIKFISFDRKILTWESCPSNECKELFKRYFSPVIRPLLNEIFGVGVKIEVKRCQKIEEEKKEVKKKPTITDKSEEVIRKVREIFGTDVEITKINH